MKHFILLLFVLASSLWAELKIGEKSPNLIGRTLDNSLYRLSEDTLKVKVINFFWIGCEPCRREIPELARMEQKYSKVKFISVHARDDTPEAVKKFIASLESTPKTIVLAGSLVRERFLFTGLPYTLILDQNNHVIANFSGYTPDNMKKIEDILYDLSQQTIPYN